MSLERQLIAQISNLVWSDGDAEMILQRVQGYLYEYEQICDHATEEQERHWAEYANSMK